MCYPYKVNVKLFKNNVLVSEYSDFGKTEDNSKWTLTAKRVLKEQAGIAADFVKSTSIITHIPVTDIPKEIKKDWPVGIKTIDVFNYEFYQQ